MNQVNCVHAESLKTYVCLEGDCFKDDQELKAACYDCLLKTHPHSDCLKHINEILTNANQNKQGLLKIIESKIKFCGTITQKLNEQKSQFESEISQWISQQYQAQFDQITKYKNTLNQQMQIVTNIQFTNEQLKQTIEYKLMDVQLFEKDNDKIQQFLESNESSFSNFFNLNFTKMKKNHETQVLEELPKFQRKNIYTKIIKKEQCKNKGCSKQLIDYLCTEKNCLSKGKLDLFCSRCERLKDTQKHQDYYKNSEMLWKKQNELIDKHVQSCNLKQKEIQEQSKNLQEMITECQNLMEQKLTSFKNFVKKKEIIILNNLEKLKTTYSKDKFTIYQLILIEDDLQMFADFTNLRQGFLGLQGQFSSYFENEKQMTVEKFEEHWFKGQYNLKGEQIEQNPISQVIFAKEKKIQDLETNLETQKKLVEEYKSQVEKSQGAGFLQEIDKKFTEVQNKINSLSACYGANQQHLQQKTVEILRLGQSMQQLYARR